MMRSLDAKHAMDEDKKTSASASKKLKPSEGQRFEVDYYQYLSPESFTILEPHDGPDSPPHAPDPYK